MNARPKSDVGYLRLQSPTSDLGEDEVQKRADASIREVPLRDLARYAGRVIRATVAEGSTLLITDRGRPLATIIPVSARVDVPTYEWVEPELEPQSKPGLDDLSQEERDLLLRLETAPLTKGEILRTTGKTIAAQVLTLERLQAKGLVRRTSRGWQLA